MTNNDNERLAQYISQYTCEAQQLEEAYKFIFIYALLHISQALWDCHLDYNPRCLPSTLTSHLGANPQGRIGHLFIFLWSQSTLPRSVGNCFIKSTSWSSAKPCQLHTLGGLPYSSRKPLTSLATLAMQRYIQHIV